MRKEIKEIFEVINIKMIIFMNHQSIHEEVCNVYYEGVICQWQKIN